MEKVLNVIGVSFDILSIMGYGVSQAIHQVEAAALPDPDMEVEPDFIDDNFSIGDWDDIVPQPPRFSALAKVFSWISHAKKAFMIIKELIKNYKIVWDKTLWIAGKIWEKIFFVGVCIILGGILTWIAIIFMSHITNVSNGIIRFLQRHRQIIEDGLIVISAIIFIGYPIFQMNNDDKVSKKVSTWLGMLSTLLSLSKFSRVDKILVKKPQVYWGVHGFYMLNNSAYIICRQKGW